MYENYVCMRRVCMSTYTPRYEYIYAQMYDGYVIAQEEDTCM
jgi:hypothetical protein